ncbi:MAG: chloride channel protein [Hyphomicrobiales bacterium]|nr:chloride channel protein [Hyphomicrobiales bacterium]
MNLNANRYATHMAVRSRIAVKRWRRRALFVAGGLAVGAAAVLMAVLADGAQRLFFDLLKHWRYAALIVTPAGFALAAYAAQTVFPNSQGSGIPQVIAALHLEEPEARAPLVSLRVGLGKIALLTLGLLCGASSGREGPTVQVGASLMFAIGRFSPYRQAGFVLAGAAAGVAAAFNTPLAGIVFGIEELSRSFEAKASGLIVGAIIAAGLTSLALVGDYSYFGSTSATLPLGREWAAIVALAVVGGLGGALFSKIVVAFGNSASRAGRFVRANPILFAALCGLGVAMCGLGGDISVFGTGYEQARSIVHGEQSVDLWFGPLKFVASVLSAVSGIPGGIFSPSLSIGAGLAPVAALVFHTAPIGALALIGMVAYLTGVLQAPITAFVIVSEMTNDHAMVIPLMMAALIANAASKSVSRQGLYHLLARNFMGGHASAER